MQDAVKLIRVIKRLPLTVKAIFRRPKPKKPSRTDNPPSWLTNKKAALVIALAGLTTYATGLLGPFWMDDYSQIVTNPIVHSLTNIGIFFTEGTFYNPSIGPVITGGYYRPMMSTVFSLMYTLFGLHTIAYHSLQLALGIGSTFLLFLVFRYSFRPLLSLILALVFLVHPLDSQVLFAIPSMQDALYFFFGILALWIILRFDSRRSLILACFSLFIAMLSKETAVLFVACSILYLLLFDRRRLGFFTAYVTVPITVYALLYRHSYPYVTAPRGSSPINSSSISVADRLLTAPSTVTFYLSKLVWPRNLATGYYWVITKPTLGGFWLPLTVDIIFLAVLVWLALVLKRRVARAEFKTYVFFVVWMILGLSITSQIVPLDMTACETWFYFSMAGLLGAVGVVLQYLIPKKIYRYRRLACVTAGVVLLLLSAQTAMRGLDWENNSRLDFVDIKNSPQNFAAYDRITNRLTNSGHNKAAISYAYTSIRLFPSYHSYQDLGVIMVRMGRYRDAISLYSKALSLGTMPDLIEQASQLNAVYGNPNDAQTLINSGLAQYPRDPRLWMDLALVNAQEHNMLGVTAALNEVTRYGKVDKNLASKLLGGQAPAKATDLSSQ